MSEVNMHSKERIKVVLDRLTNQAPDFSEVSNKEQKKFHRHGHGQKTMI